jgi:hypothetical protein
MYHCGIWRLLVPIKQHLCACIGKRGILCFLYRVCVYIYACVCVCVPVAKMIYSMLPRAQHGNGCIAVPPQLSFAKYACNMSDQFQVRAHGDPSSTR